VDKRPPTNAQRSYLNVAAALLCVAAVYAAFVSVDLTRYSAYWFVHVGERSLKSASTSTTIKPSLGWESPLGYDGQYYFFLALDPRHAKDYMGNEAGYVYARPVYPALSRALALGSAGRLPFAMLGLNLLAVTAASLGLAVWLRAKGLSPWYALLYGTFPGLVFSVARDLTEPVAYAFVVLSLLAFDESRRSRVVLAACLLALAGLTRETTLVFVLAPVLVLLRTDRKAAKRGLRALGAWLRAGAFVAATVLPLLIWRAAVSSYVGGSTQEHPGGGLTSLIPLHGLASYWPWHGQHLLILGTVVVPTVASVIGALLVLRHRLGDPGPWLVLANAAAFVFFLPAPVDIDYGSAARAAIGVVLAWIYCLPALRATADTFAIVRLGAVLWSAMWFVVVGAALSLPVVSLVIT
jgi:hypothetical protein